MQSAAGTLKKISLRARRQIAEHLFADSDFESALTGALWRVPQPGRSVLGGQPDSRRAFDLQQFLEAMVEKARGIRVGNGLERETQDGTAHHETHRARVLRYQEIGEGKQSWRSAAGVPAGKQFGADSSSSRRFSTMSTTRARIAQEEIFGPVAAVIPFDDEERASKRSRTTRTTVWPPRYWSRDVFRVMRVVRALRAGVVWVNQTQVSAIEAPWGGYKQSGFGRELGRWGVEEYLQVKQVYINVDEQPLNGTNARDLRI